MQKVTDENTVKGFPRAEGTRGRSQKVANQGRSRVQIEGAVQKAA
jgi:hypothetical protein